jgi:hypothetical protein
MLAVMRGEQPIVVAPVRVMIEGGQVMVRPSETARACWLSTVDADALGTVAIRQIGPGISDPSGPVRLWCSPSGAMVLTDGPVEAAHWALERLRASEEA